MSNRKPPLHPNRQQQFIKNSTPVPVHNTSTTTFNNNRLLNNTIFQNNQYTFSLSRISGYNYNNSGVGLSSNGYLETRPLSSASIHGGDGGGVCYINRGTKSDIGVPVRRSSTKSSSTNGNHYYNSSNFINKIPSANSDLISYISSAAGHNYAYFGVDGGNTTDYLENYRTTKNQLLRHKNHNHNHTHTHSSPSSKSIASSSNQNSLGPLLYLESGSDNMSNQQNANIKFNQSVKNVSNSLNKWHVHCDVLIFNLHFVSYDLCLSFFCCFAALRACLQNTMLYLIIINICFVTCFSHAVHVI